MVGIHGLLHPSHICNLLQFLEVPPKHWLSAVEGTVLASVNAFHFKAFSIVCVLVAFLRELRLGLVSTR